MSALLLTVLLRFSSLAEENKSQIRSSMNRGFSLLGISMAVCDFNRMLEAALLCAQVMEWILITYLQWISNQSLRAPLGGQTTAPFWNVGISGPVLLSGTWKNSLYRSMR